MMSPTVVVLINNTGNYTITSVRLTNVTDVSNFTVTYNQTGNMSEPKVSQFTKLLHARKHEYNN